MSDDDIRKLLRDADPDVKYPGHLRTATRAEYETRVRTNRKRPGCPFTAVIIVGLALSIGWVLTHFVLILGLLGLV